MWNGHELNRVPVTFIHSFYEYTKASTCIVNGDRGIATQIETMQIDTTFPIQIH